MDKLIGEMYNIFDAHRNVADAEKMTAYLLNQFPHFGIKSIPRRELAKRHNQNLNLEEKDFLPFSKICFKYPEREMHHYCLDTLHQFKKKFTPETIKTSEFIITHNSWWDTVDTCNTLINLEIFKKNNNCLATKANQWKCHENMWLRRSAIISQLKFRHDTNINLLTEVIEANLGSDQFFINKAIGLALREYGNYNPDWVLNFVEKTPLAPLSRREAIRKIIQ